MECEDCHEPHDATRGSASAPYIQRVMNAVSGADPVWPNDTPGSPSGYTWLPQADREYQVCLKCHSSFTTLPNYRPDGWNGTANLHRLHASERSSCYTCHDTHGSEQAYLINFIASAMTFLNNRNSQTAWYPTATGGGCYLTCHNQEHNPKTYSR